MSVGSATMDRLLPLLLLLAVCAGCKKSRETRPQVSSPAQPKALQRTSPAEQRIEACMLITKEQVGAVQSTTISDTKSSGGPGGNYLITQCYYAAIGPNLSVSLAVTQRDPRSSIPPSPR